MKLQTGIQISLDGNTWYPLTDHNRKEIDVTPTLIEHSQRMANGRMRKYVIATKKTITTSWTDIPSLSTLTVDQSYSSAWFTEFYNANVYVPVYVKFNHSKDSTPSTGSYPDDSTYLNARQGVDVIKCYITKFNVKTKKRMTNWDYVDMDVEFTEI
jgi:hypothetical protein